MRLPGGWRGRITRGVLVAADGPVPADGRAPAPPRGLVLELVEHGGSDAPFVTSSLPLQLVATEFVSDGDGRGARTGRSFVASGRRFALSATAGALRPEVAALEAANAALATLTIAPGDPYPGRVEPATFEPAPGWHTGDSGAADVRPDGEQTASWAATVPYADEPFALPPHQTLDRLPPTGIAVVALLSRTSVSPPAGKAGARPARFELRAADCGGFEGVPADRTLWILRKPVAGRYDVELWVAFGRAEPTPEQVDRAQAEIDRLRLPDWGAWELDEGGRGAATAP